MSSRSATRARASGDGRGRRRSRHVATRRSGRAAEQHDPRALAGRIAVPRGQADLEATDRRPTISRPSGTRSRPSRARCVPASRDWTAARRSRSAGAIGCPTTPAARTSSIGPAPSRRPGDGTEIGTRWEAVPIEGVRVGARVDWPRSTTRSSRGRTTRAAAGRRTRATDTYLTGGGGASYETADGRFRIGAEGWVTTRESEGPGDRRRPSPRRVQIEFRTGAEYFRPGSVRACAAGFLRVAYDSDRDRPRTLQVGNGYTLGVGYRRARRALSDRRRDPGLEHGSGLYRVPERRRCTNLDHARGPLPPVGLPMNDPYAPATGWHSWRLTFGVPRRLQSCRGLADHSPSRSTSPDRGATEKGALRP